MILFIFYYANIVHTRHHSPISQSSDGEDRVNEQRRDSAHGPAKPMSLGRVVSVMCFIAVPVSRAPVLSASPVQSVGSRIGGLPNRSCCDLPKLVLLACLALQFPRLRALLLCAAMQSPRLGSITCAVEISGQRHFSICKH